MTRTSRNLRTPLFFASLLLLSLLHPAWAQKVDFNRDVRPVLSDRCFRCHGPDSDAREAELRLDEREGLFSDRDGFVVVKPGSPDKSDLWERITSDDPDIVMPPPDANKPLTKSTIEMLRRWIEQGAPWNEHWAFVKPKKTPPPQVGQGWATNEIDRFVYARMSKAGLKPSGLADPVTLVRRLHLDLVGLPPTPEVADRWSSRLNRNGRFQAVAWEQLVDQLLKSPEYGPRWARRWLDLARYADTNGYEKDRDRSIWPYRDYVIRAINEDIPFDQFTVEQIAGDMLPDATRRQRVATGFHRNTMLNEEGGIDPLEFRFHAMTDRVATTGTAWLGLTLTCVQCHTHKYDPISQREYYQLMAFLNNADEPYLEIPTEAQTSQFKSNQSRAQVLLEKLKQEWPSDENAPSFENEFDKWWKANRSNARWIVMQATTLKSNLPHLAQQQDGSVFASGDSAKHDTYHVGFADPPGKISAIRLEALPDDRLPARGPGMTYYEGTIGDFFLGEIQIKADGAKVEIADASHSYAKNRYANDRNPVSARLATDGDLQTGWSVHERQGERHSAVFVFKEPIENAKQLEIRMDFGRHFGSALGRFRVSATAANEPPRARDLPLDVEQILDKGGDSLATKERAQLEQAFLMQAAETKKQAEAIRKLQARPAFRTTLVMAERPADNPRPTHLHHRGEYLQPKEQVTAAVFDFMHDYDDRLPRNRLGFAKWLASRENTLTARVTVNRHWAAFFGRGIVTTSDDFGLQGQPPTHPQLLDWLAVEFMEQGWSMKQLHKSIVMSNTYRQSSRVSEQAIDKDPGNTWWARAPRFRLEAEVIRDSALSSSGLLSLKAFGPPVRPPQPKGVTEAAYGRPKWNASLGEDRFRRSIYTFAKRTAPFAMFNTFDAPTGESCTAKRNQSNTALQALTLLNDVMFIEIAQNMGDVSSIQAKGDAQRVEWVFRRILTRRPSNSEQSRLLAFVALQRQHLQAGTINATQIASADKPDATERAVWTLLARALFALDENITRN